MNIDHLFEHLSTFVVSVVLPLVTFLIQRYVRSQTLARSLEGAAQVVTTLVLAEDREYRRLQREGRWDEEAAAGLRSDVLRQALAALTPEQHEALRAQWGAAQSGVQHLIESTVTSLKGRGLSGLPALTLTAHEAPAPAEAANAPLASEKTP